MREIAAHPVYVDVTLAADAAIELPAPAGHQAVAYLFEGSARFGPRNSATQVSAVRMAAFGDGQGLRAEAGDLGARFMLMAGAPIREPIVPYGPFVMNTEDEIRQTLAELRSGTFALQAR